MRMCSDDYLLMSAQLLPVLFETVFALNFTYKCVKQSMNT